MNYGPLLFLGIFFSMAVSFAGMILGTHFTVGHQQQVVNETTGALYPANRAGLAAEGAAVYRSLGCVECHTQQVRGLGNDRKRGWGARISVAQDYLGDYPVLLGNLRIGPDLMNIGSRKPSRELLLQQLYEPQKVTPGSMMPPYRFLFEHRLLKPGQAPARNALNVAGLKPGEQLVPTHKAEALVAYLLSLSATAPLFEAPLPPELRPPPMTNAPAGTATNAPATNAPTQP